MSLFVSQINPDSSEDLRRKQMVHARFGQKEYSAIAATANGKRSAMPAMVGMLAGTRLEQGSNLPRGAP
jgi:hypothetical protein